MAICLENPMNRDWFLADSYEIVCPGLCDPAFALDNDGHWRCGCGHWRPVKEAPRLLFPELAVYEGQRLWGDIWSDEQEAELAALDSQQRRLRDLLDGAKAREASAAMARAAAESEIAKAQSIVCDRSGKLKKQVMRPCRDAMSPAVIIGSDNRKYAAVADLPHGISVHRIWKAGCEMHAKGCCEFLHPDQPEWAEFQAGSRPSSASGTRDFSGLRGKQQQRR